MNIQYAFLVLISAFAGIYFLTLIRTWSWDKKPAFQSLRGLALPNGSIRGLIAFLIIAGFLVFAFFGVHIFPTEVIEVAKDGTKTITRSYDDALFNTVLAAFGTLTGAVTGFYFGGRGAQPKPEPEIESKPELQPEPEPEPKAEPHPKPAD